MRGRYLYLENERIAGEEVFDFVQHPDRVEARMELQRFEQEGKILRRLEAHLDSSFKVRRLKIERSGAEGGIDLTAEYGWNDDSWDGWIRGPGAAQREVSIPLVGGLEVECPLTAFWNFFLKRTSLPPLSQRRVEFLRIQLEDLNTSQTYAILERLEEERLPWQGREILASCYRKTDPFGRQEKLWLNEQGICLLKASHLQAPSSCRLVDFVS